MYRSGKVFRIFKNVGYLPPHHLIEIAPSLGKATSMSKLAQKYQITTLHYSALVILTENNGTQMLKPRTWLWLFIASYYKKLSAEIKMYNSKIKTSF